MNKFSEKNLKMAGHILLAVLVTGVWSVTQDDTRLMAYTPLVNYLLSSVIDYFQLNVTLK